MFGHDVVREGFARDGVQQLCVSTSFGLFDERKVYVQVELAGRYQAQPVLRCVLVASIWNPPHSRLRHRPSQEQMG